MSMINFMLSRAWIFITTGPDMDICNTDNLAKRLWEQTWKYVIQIK